MEESSRKAEDRRREGGCMEEAAGIRVPGIRVAGELSSGSSSRSAVGCSSLLNARS